MCKCGDGECASWYMKSTSLYGRCRNFQSKNFNKPTYYKQECDVIKHAVV